jgi:hypothetical protein
MIQSKINNRIQANNINIIKREEKIQEKHPHKILKHTNINQHNKKKGSASGLPYCVPFKF